VPTNDTFDLTNRVAVVTAGCAGLGASIAEALAGRGARVVATSRDADRATLFEREKGGAISGRPLVFEKGAIARFVDDVVVSFGSLDILVNAAAGRASGGSVEASSEEDLIAEFRDGCVSAFMMSQGVMATHDRTRTRSIVNVGSIYGSLAVDHRIYEDAARQTAVGYACTKGALIQLTRYLAAYWAPRGVRVNCISAGGVKRAQTPGFYERYAARVPMGRMAEAAEIANAVAFLASDSSSYITGVDLAVDGGLHVW
jgi:NAD(P)-dependent dehydrogenase (short-subunit alcohol dehydrogenase family)